MRSQLGGSRALSPVDMWEMSLKPNRMEHNLELTLKLISNFGNSLTCSHLIMEKLSRCQTNPFMQIIKAILEDVELLCQNSLISNLTRVSEGKSIVASTTIQPYSDLEQKNIYKASMILLSLAQKKTDQKEKKSVFEVFRTYGGKLGDQDPDVEENMQVMKFFEGVRRYQDQQDSVAIQAIQKLRDYKELAIRNLAVQRGFHLSRLEQNVAKTFSRRKRQLFDLHRRSNGLGWLASSYHLIEERSVRSSFDIIKRVSRGRRVSQLFNDYLLKSNQQQGLTCARQLRQYFVNKSMQAKGVRWLALFFSTKKTDRAKFLFRVLENKPRPKMLKLAKTLLRVCSSFTVSVKRRHFRRWLSKNPAGSSALSHRLCKLFKLRVKDALGEIRDFLFENRKAQLSHRIKGKIVASVMRAKHQDANLREAVLKWWLLSKPREVQKSFMHMFLYAPTRPFTYFLRLKNSLKKNRVRKVSARSLLFVMLLKEKCQKFMAYQVKDKLSRWQKWNSIGKCVEISNRSLGKWVQHYHHQNTKCAFRTMVTTFSQLNAKKRLMTKFFHAITGSGVGKVFKVLEVWKQLPNCKEAKKKRMMLNTINKALERIRRQVRISFQACKEWYQIGQQKKRSAALTMIKTTGGGVQQSFKKWQDSMRINKTINRCKHLNSFLESTATMITAQYGIIFENPKDAFLREKYLIKLVQAQTGNVHKYFSVWVNSMKQARMKNLFRDKEKKIIVGRMASMVGSQSATGMKAVIQKLYINSKVKQKQVHFIRRLMQTKAGKLLESVRIWKDLPQKNRMSKVKNGQIFYRVLSGLADIPIVKAFKSFAEDLEEGELRKKAAMRTLMNQTSSDVRKFYIKWHGDTKKQRVVHMCKTTMGLLESLTQVVRGNMLIVLQSQRGMLLKQKMMNKMFQNLGGGLKFYMKKWHQRVKVLAMQTKISSIQRKHYVSILSSGIDNKKSDLVRSALRSLYKNMRIKKISASFFNKLLDSKSGMTMRAVQVWLTLPSKDLNKKKKKALKFQKKLQDLAEKDFRFCFTIFKTDHLRGQSKQKYILNRLVSKCMSYQQRKYIHWKSITKELVLLDKARLLGRAFENIHSVVAIPFKQCLFAGAKQECFRKQKLVTLLVKNNVIAMQSGFDIWKVWSTNITMAGKFDRLTKLAEIVSSKRLLQSAMTTIKQEKELQTQRTYINSLWRWKTSQFEAEYYNKFIEMFKESQVLLSFSKFVNNRLSGTYGWAFSRLKGTRHDQQFKYNFVKKYMTRKALFYLERFSQGSKLKEIHRWRTKFQSSIRAMMMLQSLQKALRKVKSYELRNWNRIVKKFCKAKDGLNYFHTLVGRLKSSAFELVKDNSRLKRVVDGFNILSSLQRNNQVEAIRCLRRALLISRMAEVLRDKWRQSSILFMENLKEYSNNQAAIQEGLKKLSKVLLKSKLTLESEALSKISRRHREVDFVRTLQRSLTAQVKNTYGNGFHRLKGHLHNQHLLIRFKAAQRIYGIYEKTWKRTVGKYLGRWKDTQREGVWLQKSVEMLAVKASIKSSLAISVWRMRMYKDLQP